MHWIIHGVHHDHPNDPMRLVMPPAVSIPLGAVVFGVHVPDLRPTLRARRSARASSPGYLVYDMTHYYLHHFRPRGRLGRMLRERHMRHHFQDDTRGFGISAPYWDEVFRTSPREQAILAMSGIAADVADSRIAGRGLDSALELAGSSGPRTGRGTSRKEEEPWPPPTSTGSS